MLESVETPDPSLALRRRMIEEQIRRRGVQDEGVLGAMMTIPREQFLPVEIRGAAYEDRALPIGFGQTISQPFIVAYMTHQLGVTPGCSVLEIGTGTGYQTAVLAALARHVYSIERIADLHARAAGTLVSMGVVNVTLLVGDGSLGWPTNAPYDRVLVTAGGPKVPHALTDQLADGGVMVIPVGDRREQTVVRVVRNGERIVETSMLGCRFVSLIGMEGWSTVDGGL